MARLLTILSIILVILFFPPATLALISNNAVPGDATYPIKRGLEEVILQVASMTPQTKALFSIQRSNRRFEEAAVLISKNATQTSSALDELVTQTESVAKQIDQIQDPVKKEELTAQLTTEIKKYDDGLEKVKQEIAQVPVPTPIPISTSTTTLQTSASILPTSTPTPRPTYIPSPAITPTPSSTRPYQTPSPTPLPSPSQHQSICDKILDPIEKARCKLEQIQLGLKAINPKVQSYDKNNENKNLTPKVDTDKIKKEEEKR